MILNKFARGIVLAGFAVFSSTVSNSQSAQAAFVATIEEVGGDVVLMGSGSIDLNGLTYLTDIGSSALLRAGLGELFTTSDLGSAYLGASGPTNFGTGGAFSPNTVPTGDHVGIDVFNPGARRAIIVPFGYTSGANLATTMKFLGQTFVDLGLDPGKYVWSWGQGADLDTFTLQIGVPEPASLTVLGVGVAAIGLARRRWLRSGQKQQC